MATARSVPKPINLEERKNIGSSYYNNRDGAHHTRCIRKNCEPAPITGQSVTKLHINQTDTPKNASTWLPSARQRHLFLCDFSFFRLRISTAMVKCLIYIELVYLILSYN